MPTVTAQLGSHLPDKDGQRVRALLLDAVNTRDNEAFGRLFQVFSDDLHRRFARRLSRFPRLRKKQAVDDMVQETAICALRGFRRFQGEDPQLFQRWLARIARSVFADAVRHARKKKRDIARERSRIQDLTVGSDPAQASAPALEDTADVLGGRREQTPGDLAARSERRDILLDLLGELSPHYRQVILLRSIQGLSAAETARTMKIDRRYVEVMRLRAIKKLGKLLMERGFSNASF